MRIAEARARASLRAEVTAEDAEDAILIVMRFLQEVGIDLETMKPDVGVILTGKSKSLRDKTMVIVDLIVGLKRDTGVAEYNIVVEEGAKRLATSKEEVQRIIAQLQRDGMLYEPRSGYLKKAEVKRTVSWRGFLNLFHNV